MTVLNSLSARNHKWINETNHEPSQTIPDQAISAPELLRRFATGQPLGFKNVEAVYDEDPNYDVPEFYKLSKLDRLHIMQENHERVKDLKSQTENYLRSEQNKKLAQEEQEQRKKQEATQAKSERGTTNEVRTNE